MKNTYRGLTGNQLKLIAMVCMTLDHIGLLLLPRLTILRVIGRLAFPVYAYMLTEGCIYTRSMGKRLGVLVLSAAVCQGVYLVALGSLYMYILVTFSAGVGLIWLAKWAQNRKTPYAWGALLLGILLAFFISEILPRLLKGTDFGVDYGFVGIALPLCLYLCKSKGLKLAVLAVGLSLLVIDTWDIQVFALLSLPLLALYNGQRGKGNFKWGFYLYYPLHLAVLYAIALLLQI